MGRGGAGRKSVLEVSTGYEYPRQKGILYDGQFTRVDKKKPCAFATPAVVVGGKERGQALTVCVDAGCKEHHGRSSYGGGESWKKKQAAEVKKRKAEHAARVVTAAAVLEKLDGHAPIPLKVRHIVALALFRNYPFKDQSKVLVQYGVEIPKGVYDLSKHASRALAGKDAAALDFFLLRVVLAVEYFNQGADVVSELAAALGVKSVKPAVAANAKKKPAPKAKPTAAPKKKTKAA